MVNADFARIGRQLSTIREHVVLQGREAARTHSFMTALEEVAPNNEALRPLLDAFHRVRQTDNFPILGSENIEASQEAVSKMLSNSSDYDVDTLAELVNEFLSNIKPGNTLEKYVSETRGNFAQEINQALVDNRSELMLPFINQLKDNGYFNEFPEDNPIVSYMLNGLLALNGVKTLQLENFGSNHYLAKLPEYRFDSIKAVLNGKLNSDRFDSADFASDPYNESLDHIKTALKRNPSLTFLAAIDLLRDEVVNQQLSPAKLIVKLGNLRSALSDS
jgi:hypothetical protein